MSKQRYYLQEILYNTILKGVILLVTLCSASTGHAQNRMDKIKIHLPTKYTWVKGLHRFRHDSTDRLQSWYVNDSTEHKMLAVVIASKDKMELMKSYQELKKHLLTSGNKDKKRALLKEGTTSAGYDFILTKNILTKKNDENKPESTLEVFLETQADVHFLAVRSFHLKLSDAFIKQWSRILTHPDITPAKPMKVAKTRITLSAPPQIALADSTIQNRLYKSFKERLKKSYKRTLRPQDVRFKKNQIYITLRGHIDTTAIVKVLKKNNVVSFMPVYHGENDQGVTQKMSDRIKGFANKNLKNTLPIIKKSESPAFAKVLSAYKKKALPFIKKLPQELNLPEGIVVNSGYKYFVSYFPVYLIDAKNKVMDGNNIIGMEKTYEAGTPALKILLDAKGTKKLAAWTGDHVFDYLAIVINKKVFTAPKIQAKILNGKILITDHSVADLSDLYRSLQFSYPVPIKIEDIHRLNFNSE